MIGVGGKSTHPNQTTHTSLRSFELKTSVYEGKENNNEYTILCLYPEGNRFKNTPCPNRHALVSVFGQIVGFNSTLGQLLVLIDDIVFLSTKGSITGERDREKASNSITSPKRKWDGWGNKSYKHKVVDMSASLAKNEELEAHTPGSDSPLTVVSSPSTMD